VLQQLVGIEMLDLLLNLFDQLLLLALVGSFDVKGSLKDDSTAEEIYGESYE